MTEPGRDTETYEKAKKEIAEYESAIKKPKSSRVKSVRTSSGVRFGYRRKDEEHTVRP